MGQHCHASASEKDSDGFHSIHPGVCHSDRWLNPFNIRPEMHHGKINAVHANIQKRSPGQFRPHNPLFVRDRIRKIGCQYRDIANDSAVDNFLNHISRRHVSCPDCLSNKDLLLLRIFPDLFCLPRVHCKWLFAQNRLFMPDTQLHVIEMAGVRRCDIDQLHFRIRTQLFVASVSLLKSIFPGKFFRAFQSTRSCRIAFCLSHLS